MERGTALASAYAALAGASFAADGEVMSNPSDPRAVIVRQLPIELSQLLKFAGMTESGGDAKRAISEGLVQVNGVVEMQKGKKLAAGDRVTFGGETVVVRLGDSAGR